MVLPIGSLAAACRARKGVDDASCDWKLTQVLYGATRLLTVWKGERSPRIPAGRHCLVVSPGDQPPPCSGLTHFSGHFFGIIRTRSPASTSGIGVNPFSRYASRDIALEVEENEGKCGRCSRLSFPEMEAVCSRSRTDRDGHWWVNRME